MILVRFASWRPFVLISTCLIKEPKRYIHPMLCKSNDITSVPITFLTKLSSFRLLSIVPFILFPWGFSGIVFGAELSIEQGKSTTWFADTRFYTPASYGAISLRTEGSVYLEAIQGGWGGVNNSRFIGGSLGVRYSKKFFAEGSLGVVRLLTPQTTQLDGPNQFLVSVGLGVKIDNLIGSIRLRHFSNAGTKGKNHGFEVKLFSVGVVF